MGRADGRMVVYLGMRYGYNHTSLAANNSQQTPPSPCAYASDFRFFFFSDFSFLTGVSADLSTDLSAFLSFFERFEVDSTLTGCWSPGASTSMADASSAATSDFLRGD